MNQKRPRSFVTAWILDKKFTLVICVKQQIPQTGVSYYSNMKASKPDLENPSLNVRRCVSVCVRIEPIYVHVYSHAPHFLSYTSDQNACDWCRWKEKKKWNNKGKCGTRWAEVDCPDTSVSPHILFIFDLNRRVYGHPECIEIIWKVWLDQFFFLLSCLIIDWTCPRTFQKDLRGLV